MIKYNTKNWFLFLFRHGLKHVGGHFSSVLVVGVYTALIILAHERFFPELSLDNTVFKMLGIVLGLLWYSAPIVPTTDGGKGASS